MKRSRDRDIQNISNCSLSLFAGMGIYLATANQLGTSRLVGLGIGLALTIVLMLAFRAIVSHDEVGSKSGYWLLLPFLAVLFIVAINYGGMIRLWISLTGVNTPFYVYLLLAASLLVLSGYKGERAILRLGPIIVLLIIIAAVFDTIFIVPKADPALLIESSLAGTEDLLLGGVKIMLSLAAPGLLFIFWHYFYKGSKKSLLSKADLLWSAIFPVAYLVLSQVRDLLLAGNLIALDDYPLLRTLKSVDFGVGVSRLEFLGIIALSAGIMIAIMLEFIILVRMGEHLLHIKGNWNLAFNTVLVLILGAAAYLLFTHQLVYWLLAAAIVLMFAYGLISIKRKQTKSQPPQSKATP